MSEAAAPLPHARAIHALCAVALSAVLLGNYLPLARVLDLSRASLGIQGDWIGNHSRQIENVTPGGPADRAGLRAGDVLLFNPERESDWVLAGYRDMPDAFSANLPVRRADGSTSVVQLAPDRVVYLPTLNDRLALLARLAGMVVSAVLGALLVWVRPGFMTWSLQLALLSGFPIRIYADYYLGFEAQPGFNLLYYLPCLSMTMGMAYLPFALSFPYNAGARWPTWQRVVALALAAAYAVFTFTRVHIRAFEGPVYEPGPYFLWVIGSVVLLGGSIWALMRTYRRSDAQARARLKWALLGMGVVQANVIVFLTILTYSFVVADTNSGSQVTPGNWVFAVSSGILFPVSFGYAVLRERVVDLQFAVSRTLVYGAVSALVVVILAVLHWLLGRSIEHAGLAFGLEGLAAVGLGIVLHRASHGINRVVDRVIFQQHHQAEERLRRVITALPFATSARSIADALVEEPLRNLRLASAALFHRDSDAEPLRRVLAHGWDEGHAEQLGADSLLVRYLQAEHAPLFLRDSQLLPERLPQGSALPVLAIPVVQQHALQAVVLYGAHMNSTLPDPDEVELLHTLAQAAAASHQHVRTGLLQREVAALTRENAVLARETETQRRLLSQLGTSLGALLPSRGVGGPQAPGPEADAGARGPERA